MDRQIVAGSLAGVAGVAQFLAPVAPLLTATNVRLVDGVLFGLSVVISVAVPVTGAVLVARRRAEGVAVLVTAALIALPAIASLGYFLASASGGAGDSGSQAAMTALYLVAQVAMVAAGAAAWGLRDADRWRWDRPVPSPYVALALVSLLPSVVNFITAHGVLFPVAMVATANAFDLAMLAQLLVVVGLLVWAARLPRRTSAAVLLVLFVPRLYESLFQAVGSEGFGMPLGPYGWLGMAAEAALVGTACWWLSRGDDVLTRVEPTTPSAPVT